MVQVPSPCGHCATVIHKDGLCKPDGSPLLVLIVVNCHGDEITSSIIDPENGLPYIGPIIECNALAVEDTDSIDLTLVDNVLSADLILDPSSEAPVEITPDGLKVDCCPDDGGWTTQVKTGNEAITDAVGVNLIDLPGFAPAPNGIYEIEAKLLVSSTIANNGTRGRMQFPAGMTAFGWTARSVDGSAGLEAISYGGPAVLTQSSNVPIVNTPFLIDMRGMLDAGPAPAAGNVRPQVATENAGTTVVAWRASMFKWRQVL